MTTITGILLAAGSSRRFGANKLLQPLDDGSPVGVAAASNLINALPNSIAVVRPGDTVMVEAFTRLGLTIVENPEAEQGMGTSLAAGIRAAGDAGGWLIALADMPWIQVETIRQLADRLMDGVSLVAPIHAGRRGHPVGFSSGWRALLEALRGDEGARSILAAHKAQLELLETADAGVLRDIDCPDDLALAP